jgi:hypothetical protein
MAPLPIDNTARYKVFYTNGGRQHVQDVRVNAVSPSAFGTAFAALLSAIAGDLTVTVIDEVQFAGLHSNLFFPVITGIEGTSHGGGAATIRTTTQYANFIGRSAGGRRVRAAIFGVLVISDDNRFVAGESAAFDNAIAVLVANPSIWVGIDGTQTAWKSYVNTGFNAYWQRKVRP